jgi:RNA polymerase sigma factor (sigma-70 family)
MTAALRAARVSGSTHPIFPRRRLERPSPSVNKRPEFKVKWAELIGRVASSGDREAFKALFDHFAPRIKGFLVKTGCTSEDADEIAQTTLIAVWRKASQFDPNTTGAAAWIFTIARNLRIDAARRDMRKGQLSREMELEHGLDVSESAESTFSRAESATRVAAAIDRLSPEQFTVIRLSFMEEHPHPEIAAMLGIPLGTVKSRIRLAMLRLRELLDEQT